MAKLKLIDNQDRAKLSEGRNWRMGFAFAKLTDKTLETTDPVSPCKDYLNDRCFSEHTGKDFSIYGLSTTHTGLFKDVPSAYLIFSICKKGAKNPAVYDGYSDDIKTLEKNAANIEKLLNFFEEKFNVGEKTKIIKLKRNFYVAVAPLFWTKYAYLISLYSLLTRISMFWDGEGEVMNFLEKFDKDSSDMYILKSLMGKINRMIGGEIPEQNLLKGNIHNSGGIVGFEFPKQKVDKPKEIAAKVDKEFKKATKEVKEKFFKAGENAAQNLIDNQGEFDKLWATI
jgi:hypothetical protein